MLQYGITGINTYILLKAEFDLINTTCYSGSIMLNTTHLSSIHYSFYKDIAYHIQLLSIYAYLYPNYYYFKLYNFFNIFLFFNILIFLVLGLNTYRTITYYILYFVIYFSILFMKNSIILFIKKS